uniref:G_PROTEIN_RECEP_F1_2 domain-containing protein n=1 Tax=Steinernema glaseri TaxID=37863 RepID=A0A1I7ZQF8_9BILA
MENGTIISNFDMQLLNHGTALLDFILEPYFIYLIFRCSPPAMSIYRWYLLGISLTNLVMTLNFAVIWSPVVDIYGLDICVPSSHLDGRYVPLLHAVFNLSLFAQWQLLLGSLTYAVTIVCWPV